MKLNELNIDRTNWNKVQLGELADEISQRVDNPSESEYERFVGLEHFVSGDLKIKVWAHTDNLVSSAKAFKTGDILFARRNAYLRRASLVNFAGICSGDAFVLRENHEKVVPGFLAFVLNSEKLWDYANANAAGTMSKRVKWRDLARYEFLLPPIDQQSQLADLLWAADNVVEKYQLLSNEIIDTYQYFIELQYHLTNSFKPLSEICDINKETLSSKTPPDYTFQYLDIASIIDPKVIGKLKSMTFKDSPSRARRIVKNGNLVLSLVRPYFQSFVIIEDAENIIASTGTAVLSVNDIYDRYYIFHLLFSKKFLEYCEERMMGTNYPAITPNDVKEYKIPISPLIKQKEIGLRLQELDKTDKEIKKLRVDAKRILNVLINQIFKEQYHL